MEVPEWLMKPTPNNRDHIKVLTMIEHVRRAAERKGVDPYLQDQLERLCSAFITHCKATLDLEENPVVEALEKDRKKTLIWGGVLSALILVPYMVITKTNFLHPSPTVCWNLESKEEKKTVPVCLLAVDKPYNPGNGDVSVALRVGKEIHSSTVINADFWIADEIGNQPVNYEGEFNINRTRVYNRHILVHDDPSQWSSWVKPMVPEDTVIPLWTEVKKYERKLNYKYPLIEDKIGKLVQDMGAIFAAAGSIGLTLWKFYTV